MVFVLCLIVICFDTALLLTRFLSLSLSDCLHRITLVGVITLIIISKCLKICVRGFKFLHAIVWHTSSSLNFIHFITPVRIAIHFELVGIRSVQLKQQNQLYHYHNSSNLTDNFNNYY